MCQMVFCYVLCSTGPEKLITSLKVFQERGRAVSLFLAEASGEIIPCLCARLRTMNVGIAGRERGVGESSRSLERETQLVKNSVETVGVNPQKAGFMPANQFQVRLSFKIANT